jgi:hypothetical protein
MSPIPGLDPSLQARSLLKTVAAPIGGLNARDSLANMAETDAIALTNWRPDVGGVRCRKGYQEWATNFPGGKPVGGILPYFDASVVFPGGSFLTTPTSMPGELFASTDDAIYDITSTTNAPVVAIALSGGVNAGWTNSVNFTTAGGTFLVVCSEADGYYIYDGATWALVPFGGGPTNVSVSDPGDFVQVVPWKKRLWFTKRDSAKGVYLPLDSVYGAAAEFDFGQQFKHGGHLAYLANWTIDAGEGIDDFLVAVGSNGDVLIYKGTDPTSATTFQLVGSWFVGQIPVGRRAFVQFGGDLILASADGIFPISYITRGGADFLVASSKEYSSKIRPLIGQDLRASFTELGWQLLIHPSERLMLVNVPDYSAVQTLQYAMSTSQNEWCQFIGIPIYSMGFTAGYAFAGTRDGRVVILFTSFFDNVPYGDSVGDNILGRIMPAWNYFGLPGMEKQFLMVRPVFVGILEPQVSADIAVNFQTSLPFGTSPIVGVTAAVWNTALWGVGLWGGAPVPFSEWFACGDTGFVGTATILTSCVGDTLLASIDYVFQLGGPVGG